MSRIVHLGLGNFHRAHQAVFTQDANGVTGEDRRITGVTFRNRGLVEALRAQGGRYTVLEVGPGAAAARSVDVIDDLVLAVDEPERVIDQIASATTTLVTLTVTEKGYAFRPGRHDLDVDDEAIRLDSTLSRPPTTALGLLAAGLLRRLEHGSPIDLVSCDNVGHNGAGLRTVLEQYAALLPPRPGGELAAYLRTLGTPDTMVDRIVPRTTDATRAAVARLGFADAVPVPAEPFSMWVLDGGAFTAERPAWERVGAVLSGEVGAYELVKLRLMNAPNSMFAYLGLLTGRTEIAHAASDPVLCAAVHRGLGDEMEATLDLPVGLDVKAYRAEVLGRLRNHELGHTCQQVGTDGSLKLTQRLPGAVAWHAAHGRTPPYLALSAAAWLHVTADGADLGLAEHDRPLEPAGPVVAALARRLPDARALARAALADEALLGRALGGQRAYIDRVGELLGALRAHGAGEVVGSLVAESPTRE